AEPCRCALAHRACAHRIRRGPVSRRAAAGRHHQGVNTMPGTVLLRSASIDDLELLRRWDEQPHVIESDPNDDWGWETELARSPDWREQLIAEVDGRPIGYVEIIDPARDEEHYWGEDIAPNLRAIDIWIGE